MTVEWWMTYFLTTLLFSLSPGSGAINTMSIGISHGLRSAVYSILGLQAGLMVQIVLVGIGLGTLVAHSDMAFAVLKWLGAGYLVWLGVQQWRAHGGLHVQQTGDRMPRTLLFRRGTLVNLTNPKSVIYLAALFPLFLMPRQPLAMQYLVLGVTTVVVDIAVMLGYALLAAHIAIWFRTPRQMMVLNRVFGGLFVTVAILLVISHRG